MNQSKKKRRSKANVGFIVRKSWIDNSFTYLYPLNENHCTLIRHNTSKVVFLLWVTENHRYHIFPLRNTERERIQISYYETGKWHWFRTYRLAMNISVGYSINSKFQIHHIDCNHNNNQPDNLVIVTNRQHKLLHKLYDNGLMDDYNHLVVKLVRYQAMRDFHQKKGQDDGKVSRF